MGVCALALGLCCPRLWLARLAVVDDQFADGELHLLRMAPVAWLRGDAGARFLNMPTEYGPVSIEAHLAEGRRRLELQWGSEFREAPARVILHVPPAPGLQRIIVNSDDVSWDGVSPTVELR